MKKIIVLITAILISHANAQLSLVETGANSKIVIPEYPTLRLGDTYLTGKYTVSDSKVAQIAPTALTLTISGGNSTVTAVTTTQTPQPTPK